MVRFERFDNRLHAGGVTHVKLDERGVRPVEAQGAGGRLPRFAIDIRDHDRVALRCEATDHAQAEAPGAAGDDDDARLKQFVHSAASAGASGNPTASRLPHGTQPPSTRRFWPVT